MLLGANALAMNKFAYAHVMEIFTVSFAIHLFVVETVTIKDLVLSANPLGWGQLLQSNLLEGDHI